MTDGTLLLWVVILVGVAGQTESAGRNQLGHPLRRMAGVALLVGFYRRLVRNHGLLGRMAAGACAIKFMVFDMAPGTLKNRRTGTQ